MPKTRQQLYEERGGRPGTPVGTRLGAAALQKLDEARGDRARGAWILALIHRELKINEPPPRKKGRARAL